MNAFQNSTILQLDSFDAAFPVEPGREEGVRRQFCTLFVEVDDAPAEHHAPLRKARDYLGNVFALKKGDRESPVFHEEYRTLCSVACLRGFPDVYGYGVTEESAYIIMEWVEGVTLRQAVLDYEEQTLSDGSESKLPLVSVAKLGIEVCALLEQANNAKSGFVHRDISPRNIILRTEKADACEQLRTGIYDICLIDFGSSTHVDEDPSFTKLSGVLRHGTPDYAPPEMLTDDVVLPHVQRSSETIDVYALCSVLFELYMQQTPYQLARHADSSPYRIKTTQPVPTCKRRDEDGGALALIIDAGLSLDQHARPTRAQLAQALENWLQAPHLQSPGPQAAGKRGAHTMWQPDYQRKLLTRRRVVYAGIVAAAAVVSGGIIAHKLATRRGAPQADLSSMPTTQTSYTGEPLFKVNDAQNPGWALATKNGQIICKPQTSREIGNVCEGVCSCYSDLAERYGFIAPGEHGSYAWRVLPQFAAVGDYSQGLAAAKDPETRLWGYIDIDGNWQIPPQFKEAQPFSNGVAAVLSNSVDALWGAVDTHGTWTIEPAFAALGMSNEAGYMTAQASHGQDSARSWGFVDAHGSWSCSPNFPALRRLSSGCAPAAHPKTGLWGYVDAQGTWLIRPCFKDARPFSEDAAAVQDAKSQLWYFIDATGQAADAMKPTFWKLGELVCGLAPAQASAADDTVVFDDGSKAHGAQMRYGYVDSSGTWHMKRLVTLADTAIGYPRI